jgi:large subunit ribosomal protein L6
LNNFNKGFNQNYYYKLELDGVGFRFLDITENALILKVGFSDVVKFNLDPAVFAILLSNVELLLYSSNYDLLKSTSSSIKKIKVPDTYKGKGIKYFDETIRLKEIKK